MAEIAIDDRPLFRKGVADVIEMEVALCMIAEAPDGENGLALGLELQPELILIDLNLQGMDGL